MCRWYCLSDGPSTDLICYQCGCRYCGACLHSDAGKFPSLIKCAACGRCPRTQPKGQRKAFYTPVLVMGTGSQRAPIPVLGEGRPREKPRPVTGSPRQNPPHPTGDPAPHKRVFVRPESIAERKRRGKPLTQRTTGFDRSQSWVGEAPGREAFTGTRFTERPLCEEEKDVQEQVLLERTGRVFYWERRDRTAERAPSVASISLVDDGEERDDALPRPPPSYSVSLVDGEEGDAGGAPDDFTVSFNRHRRAAAAAGAGAHDGPDFGDPRWEESMGVSGGGYRERAAARQREAQAQVRRAATSPRDDFVVPPPAPPVDAAEAADEAHAAPPAPTPAPLPEHEEEAYDDHFVSDDDGQSDFDEQEDPMEALERIFITFCEFGRGQHAANTMDSSRFAKLFRDTNLIDRRLTHIDVDLIFTKSKAINGKRIPFDVFARVALPQIAAKKFPRLPLHDALDRVVGIILSSQGPLAYGTAIANKEGGLFERLCSPDTFHGMYARRFDEYKPKYLSVAFEGDTNTGTDEIIHDISQIVMRRS